MSGAGRIVIALLVGGCRFDPPSGTDGGWADARTDGAPPDAIDGCTPNAALCSGRNLETCNATGTGIDPELTVPCALTCVADTAPRCAVASNIPIADQLLCAPTFDLAPPAGATVVVSIANGASIDCTPSCGTTTRIPRVAQILQPGGAALSWFCLGKIALPPDVTVTVNTGVRDAIAMFVTGDVNLAGTVILDGSNAGGGPNGGLPGPGGTSGGGRSGGLGVPAPGTCGGAGGDRSGNVSTSVVGGGGGGGGNRGAGGPGGPGLSDAGAAPGGDGGIPGCVAIELAPIAGGPGGGGGGDGSCGGTSLCGFAGGGGAGAIQIAAAGTLAVGGTIRAHGGTGFGSSTGPSSHGGAGGGGAGGAILLEARTVAITGVLDVTGGAGGPSGAGDGGAGAAATLDGGTGATGTLVDQGGSGGGGAAGIVRINGVANACAGSAPLAACTAGPLP